MKIIDIVSHRSRMEGRGAVPSCVCDANKDHVIFYDLRMNGAVYETPLQLCGYGRSDYRSGIVVCFAESHSMVLPKTPLSIFNNVLNYRNSMRRFHSEDGNLVIYAIGGLILDADKLPIIEFTAKRRRDSIISYVVRINANNISNPHPFFKYIFSTVLKQLIGESVRGYPIEIIIKRDLQSPLIKPEGPDPEIDSFKNKVHEILKHKAQDISSCFI